jgi:hypothetical protein
MSSAEIGFGSKAAILSRVSACTRSERSNNARTRCETGTEVPLTWAIAAF